MAVQWRVITTTTDTTAPRPQPARPPAHKKAAAKPRDFKPFFYVLMSAGRLFENPPLFEKLDLPPEIRTWLLPLVSAKTEEEKYRALDQFYEFVDLAISSQPS